MGLSKKGRIFLHGALIATSCVIASMNPVLAADVGVMQLKSFDNQNNGSIEVDTGTGHNLGTEPPIECNFYLEGKIEKGDFARLKKVLSENRPTNSNDTPRICLNSPGGSYIEGLLIAEHLINEGIGTAVPAGTKCYSSCALIFMGGSYPWKGQINRFLDAAGVLGFHAPYINGIADKPYDANTVKESFNDGIRSIRALMALGVGNKVKRFPPQLLSELLAAGPEELFVIDTIGKAIRNRIHLYGIDRKVSPSDRNFCNVCVNVLYGAYERYGQGAETDLCAIPVNVKTQRFAKGQRMTFEVAPRGGTCTIDVEWAGDEVKSWIFSDEGASWADGLELAYWYMIPPNASLRALSNYKNAKQKKPPQTKAKTEPEPEQNDLLHDLIDFVQFAYLGTGRTNHVSAAGLFASKVNYYERGRISRAAVTKDRHAYYNKWPDRRYDLIPESIDVSPRNDEQVDVTFRYRFELANSRRQISGIGRTVLSIRLRDGAFEITRENGKVLERF